MTNLEKVIRGLECCVRTIEDCECADNCPYETQCWDGTMYLDLMRDALALLRQEPDCRVCGQSSCRYYHETRKPKECGSYVRYEPDALGVFTSEEPESAHFMNGIKTAREIVEDAPTVTGWISVKDRLPENRSMCLTYSPKGKMRVAEAFLPNPDDYPNDCWWSVHGQGGHHYVAVTHWMPLPEPPGEVIGDDRD